MKLPVSMPGLHSKYYGITNIINSIKTYIYTSLAFIRNIQIFDNICNIYKPVDYTVVFRLEPIISD